MHRPGQYLLIQRFLIQHHVRLHDAAAFTPGHALAFGNELHRVEFAAPGAVVAQGAAVQLQHVFAARRLMQPVDVLGDHRLQPALSLKSGQTQMGGVGPGVLHDQLGPVKSVEFLRIRFKKAAADDLFRRVLPLLVVQTVHAAEIRDAALGAHPRAPEKHNIVALCDQILQLPVHGPTLLCLVSLCRPAGGVV